MRTTTAVLSALTVTMLVTNGGKIGRKLTHVATGRVTVDGVTVELPADDPFLRHLIVKGGRDTESTLASLIRSELNPGDTFVDVGANIGWFTLIAAKAVGPTGRVIAFEPEPRNFAKLKRNIEVNGLKNVTLEQKAVGNRPGKVVLHLGELGENHSLIPLADQKGSIEVECVRLDDYLSENHVDAVRAVKVDTEGAEGYILEGMSKTLRQPGLSLFIEFDPFLLEAAKTSPKGLIDRVKALGYSVSRIDERWKTVYPVAGVPKEGGNLMIKAASPRHSR